MKMKVRCVEISHYISFLEGKFLKKSMDRFVVLRAPVLSGIDTRMLTKKLREYGTMLGKVQSSISFVV